MNRLALAACALLILPAVVSVQASGSDAFADAGVSQRVAPGEPIPLAGHVEGFAGSPSFAWSGPASCAIADAASIATSADCPPGLHVFTFAATDGSQSASDSVTNMVVGEVSGGALLATEGDILVGADAVTVSPAVIAGYDAEHGTTLKFTANVSEGATSFTVRLSWDFSSDDFDLVVVRGGARHEAPAGYPEIVHIDDPTPGRWTIEVHPRLAYLSPWQLEAVESAGFSGTLPTLDVPAFAGELGVAQLQAFPAGGVGPYTVAWETDPSSRRFDDATGVTADVPFAGAGTVLAKLTDAQGLEVVRSVSLREAGDLARPLTVVAVIDGGFSPYHADFLGEMHPWNLDADATNDIDLSEHPAAFIPSYPGALPLPITLPTAAGDDVNALRALDSAAWATLPASTPAAPEMRWIPGTKVIGALRFGGAAFQSTNGAHGSASASVAAGNVHGSCPECVFVLIAGSTPEALAWAAAQPWIDVVTNSYGHGSILQNSTLGFTRDNAYWFSPVDATRAASERGQTIVFSAGNGFVNAFDVPMFTFLSSEKGPDWMVTVGAASPGKEQTVLGAGKPVDISSIGSAYPASGGSTRDGEGTHSGTSNAAPVTAGYFAKTLQKAREALGDDSPGNADGIVASGAPVACGAAYADCPLGDGVLTRAELHALVFGNVLPSVPDPTDVVHAPPEEVLDGAIPFATVPTTQFAYYYQGHGVLSGRHLGDAEYEAEWTRMAAAAVGDVAPYARPEGEREWFVVDSKCRQRMWGEWSGGLWRAGDASAPADPAAHPLATSYDAWCSELPAGAGLTARDTIAPADV